MCVCVRACVYTYVCVEKPGSSFKLVRSLCRTLRRMNNGGSGGGPGVKNPLFSLRRPFTRAGFFGGWNKGRAGRTAAVAVNYTFLAHAPPALGHPFCARNILKASLPLSVCRVSSSCTRRDPTAIFVYNTYIHIICKCVCVCV